ncbi:MAG: TIR domain-containing protein [Lachnospiraceae bacterium]|nr:TIR domain-containing protein [Lachnospiraceae bacterium]
MATILKCKMCGGDIEVSQDMTIGTCLYCGSTMTLPKIDSEKKARLFNRANQYRLNCEFDKALDAYKSIVEEDEQEAEAYWGMILSEYGVEYIEDPATKKMIPTCHRTHITSIKSTTNYDLACKYADSESKFMYWEEAEEIDRIQKSILAISLKEDPYDVFICYKETDTESGERTQDSVIAQDIYNELSKQGLKVFFSRITLAEKLGKDYEPYIYSALNSAKVMLVVCTSNANVNSVWVKNEWSRYLRFMQDNSQKVLIPVYKGMQIYELPDELSKFQAQDYSKVGSVQDIAYSVKKIVSTEDREKKDSALEGLIREKIQREQKISEKKVRRKKQAAVAKRMSIYIAMAAAVAAIVFGCMKLYQNVLYPNSVYRRAEKMMEGGEYDSAIDLFTSLNGYKDSSTQIDESQYLKGITYLEDGKYDDAISVFNNIEGYKDSSDLILSCFYGKGLDAYNIADYEGAIKLLDALGDYKDAHEYVIKSIVAIQLNDDKYVSSVTEIMDELSEEQLYEIGSHLFEINDYNNTVLVLKNCIYYKDSIEFCKDAYYEYIVNKAVTKETLIALYKLANGDTIKLIAPDASDIKCEKAQAKLDELASGYYEAGLAEYNATNWRSAYNQFAYVADIDYKDSAVLLANCDANIASEKAAYDGIWIEATKFWTHLKIENGKVYYSTDNASNPKKSWSAVESSYYDEDTGKLSFVFWPDDSYDVTVNGNTLTIKWTNKEDQWDSDWFGNLTRFYKSTS